MGARAVALPGARAPAGGAGIVELREDVRPAWPFRLRAAGGRDGVLRRRGASVQRVLHVGEEPVHLAAVQLAPDLVRVAARAADPLAAGYGLERLRFALGVDDDLAPFHHLFRGDPLIGRALGAHPTLRVGRRPEPWEALAWAVTEQLIQVGEAHLIQRRLVARLGRAGPAAGLRDVPSAAAVAAASPAELEACGLSAGRALTLRRAAREVAAGRVELHGPGHEAGWARLRGIRGVGAWTVEMLALHGQGRYDQVPAADLGFLKLVGRLTTGNPRARADETEVRGLLARYGEWKGLAGAFLLRGAAGGLLGAPLRVHVPRGVGAAGSAAAPSAATPSAAT